MDEQKSIAEIVKRMMQAQRLNTRTMAKQLGVSHPTIINWRDGRTEPRADFLLFCMETHDDWRRDFGRDCLRVRAPELMITDRETTDG